MDQAMRKLLPMFDRGFDERERDAEARQQARSLLVHLQTAVLYR